MGLCDAGNKHKWDAFFWLCSVMKKMVMMPTWRITEMSYLPFVSCTCRCVSERVWHVANETSFFSLIFLIVGSWWREWFWRRCVRSPSPMLTTTCRVSWPSSRGSAKTLVCLVSSLFCCFRRIHTQASSRQAPASCLDADWLLLPNGKTKGKTVGRWWMRLPKGSPSRRLGLGLAGVVSIFFLLSVRVGFIYRSSQVMQQQTHIQSPTPRPLPFSRRRRRSFHLQRDGLGDCDCSGRCQEFVLFPFFSFVAFSRGGVCLLCHAMRLVSLLALASQQRDSKFKKKAKKKSN